MGYTPQLSTAVWVGYPDVARAPCPALRAARFAAPVWHAFMLPASDGYCEDFPLPRRPSSPRPFFGKYSSTGGAGTGGYYYGEDPYGTTEDDTGDSEYDPDYYESPPQDGARGRAAAGRGGTHAHARGPAGRRGRRRPLPGDG